MKGDAEFDAEFDAEVKKVELSKRVRRVIEHYGLKSSWVPPLNRWIVRSMGKTHGFFWTSKATDEEFMVMLGEYCDENGLEKLSNID